MNQLTVNNCPFCKMVRHELSPVVVQEDNDILAVMDLYPAAPGHILVLPKEHFETIYTMPVEIGARIMTNAISIAKVLKQRLSPDGLNLIQSNEVMAGQTVSHFHLHIVPRYKNDAIMLFFGHGTIPEKVVELERIASLLRSGLRQERG